MKPNDIRVKNDISKEKRSPHSSYNRDVTNDKIAQTKCTKSQTFSILWEMKLLESYIKHNVPILFQLDVKPNPIFEQPKTETSQRTKQYRQA